MFIEEYGQLASLDGEDGRENLRKLLHQVTARVGPGPKRRLRGDL